MGVGLFGGGGGGVEPAVSAPASAASKDQVVRGGHLLGFCTTGILGTQICRANAACVLLASPEGRPMCGRAGGQARQQGPTCARSCTHSGSQRSSLSVRGSICIIWPCREERCTGEQRRRGVGGWRRGWGGFVACRFPLGVADIDTDIQRPIPFALSLVWEPPGPPPSCQSCHSSLFSLRSCTSSITYARRSTATNMLRCSRSFAWADVLRGLRSGHALVSSLLLHSVNSLCVRPGSLCRLPGPRVRP